MAAKRQSPGIGHNGGLPEHNDIRTALAVEMIFAEQEKALREKKKRARKRMESQGIILSDLSDLKAMEGMTASEIEALFRRRWHLAGAIHADKYEQLDIFAPKPSAPAVRAAHYTMGLIAGLKGAELEIPPLVTGDDRQQMIDGHNEGRERRSVAEQSLLNEALAPENAGKVADGTAAAVNKRAAADFAKDTGDDPLVVGGTKYPNMRQANAARKRAASQIDGEPAGNQAGLPAGDQPLWADFPLDSADWSDAQKDDFCNWFDAQPEDATPIQIEHAGAQAEFRRLRDAKFDEAPEAKGSPDVELPPPGDGPATEGTGKPKVSVMRPDFHAWPEDWQAWTGAQTMEFRRWFESLPADMIPPITHEGAVAYFNLLREERENKEAAGPSEAPSEEEIAAGVRKLQESGFAPAKAVRKSRNLAK